MNLKKNRLKPNYGRLLKARRNVTDNLKLFYLRKKKWTRFIFFAKKKMKFFKRYKLNDPSMLRAIKFASQGNSFKKSFRNRLNKTQSLKLIYGSLKKKHLKRYLMPKKGAAVLFNTSFAAFESKLDVVLYRSKFSSSIDQTRQLIFHGHVLLNNNKTKHCSKKVSHMDIVSITKLSAIRELVKSNLRKCSFWPVPPKTLKINYNTLEIINTHETALPYLTPSSTTHAGLSRLKNNVRFK